MDRKFLCEKNAMSDKDPVFVDYQTVQLGRKQLFYRT